MEAGRADQVRLSLHRQAPAARPAAVGRGRGLSAAPKDDGSACRPYVLRDAQNRTLPLVVDAHRYLPLARPSSLGRQGRATARDSRRRRSSIDMVDGPGDHPARSEDLVAGGQRQTSRPAACSRSTSRSCKADPAHLKPTLIYAPGPREALEGAAAAKDVLLVSILDNVRGRTLLFTPGAERQLDARGARPSRQFDDRHRRRQPHRRPGAC